MKTTTRPEFKMSDADFLVYQERQQEERIREFEAAAVTCEEVAATKSGEEATEWLRDAEEMRELARNMRAFKAAK